MFASEMINNKVEFEKILLHAKYMPKSQDLIDYEVLDVDSMRLRLLSAYERSNVVYAVTLDDKLFGIVGIKEYAPRIGNIYFNSIVIQKKNAIGFIKEGRKVLNKEKANYDLIYNRIMVVEEVAEMRWVEIMGFKIYKDDVYELPDGRKYVAYAWKKFDDESNVVFSETYKKMVDKR